MAIQTVADALPALGIVAAVLGVIKTMAAIDQPPSVLGRMIGGALVGTFLGVFLSYCLAGPLAARMRTIHEDDHRFYALIRDVLVAHLQRHAPNVCVEIGVAAGCNRLMATASDGTHAVDLGTTFHTQAPISGKQLYRLRQAD